MREYGLLVVDDEIFAVRGITEGIHWEELGIGHVYGACSVQEAMEILRTESVDVVITDIEMPKENGLDLLAWISENDPGIRVLMLTAYARFDYAAQALHYRAKDYILKPVAHEELRKIVADCIEEIRREEEAAQEAENLRAALPLLAEKFWTDVLEGRRSFYPDRLRELQRYFSLPGTQQDPVTPVLLIPGHHTGMMEAEQKCRDVLEYLREDQSSILGGASGIFYEEMLLLFICRKLYVQDRSSLLEAQKKVEDRAGIKLQMCVGPCVRLKDIPAACESLLFYSETMGESRISFCADNREEELSPDKYPLVVDWIPMLESGKREEFSQRLDELLRELAARERVGRNELQEIYIGLWYSFTVAARRNALPDIVRGLARQDRKDYRSVRELTGWCIRIRNLYFQEFEKNEKKNSTVAEKVERYVMEHISEDFKREDIANALYFNPSYLSHIFKQEKGISLNKFINQLRIQEAKRLFDTTNLPVGNVAMDTGYYNFSYFSKQFKEMYHVTPSEYKKMVGNV